MKKILLAVTLLTSVFTLAQQAIIDNIKFDNETILVGMASDYNVDKAYDKYNFLIDNSTKLDKVKLYLEHGYELNNKVADENHFMIYAIKNKKIVDQWLVNPKYYNVFYNGEAYSFDADKLEEIAKNYPLDVRIEKKIFKDEKEYKKAKKLFDKNEFIILMYEPSFVFEGSFEISVKKNDKITNAQEAEKYVSDLVTNITKKKTSISYALNEQNLMDRSQFSFVVSGPKAVFDKLNSAGVEKGSWIPEIYEAIIIKKN